jgi:hypothetical protein
MLTFFRFDFAANGSLREKRKGKKKKKDKRAQLSFSLFFFFLSYSLSVLSRIKPRGFSINSQG